MICPNCMAELDPEAHFCPSCNMPLSCIATMDPIGQIYAQGWFYHHAATARISWLGLLGMWLIFGSPALVSLPSLWEIVARGSALFGSLRPADETPNAYVGYLMFLTAVGIVVVYAAILYRVTRSFFRRRGERPGWCVACGYDLRGLNEPRCPECGTPFRMTDREASEPRGEHQELADSDDENDHTVPVPRTRRAETIYTCTVAGCLVAHIVIGWLQPFALGLGRIVLAPALLIMLLAVTGFWLMVRDEGNGRSFLFVLSWAATAFFSVFWFFQSP